MGLFNRLTSSIRAKSRNRQTMVSAMPDYRDQMCDELKRALNDAVEELGVSMKRLKMQQSSLESCVLLLDTRARSAVSEGRCRPAAVALYHKSKALEQIQQISGYSEALDRTKTRLEELGYRLVVKKQKFQSEQYSVRSRYMVVDEADFFTCEAAAGMDEEMADVEYAIGRAKAKVDVASDLLIAAETAAYSYEVQSSSGDEIPDEELAEAMRMARALISGGDLH
ncbi:MAG TPA: hypothetical protein VK436_11825 [Methanocella sp.]|nr:hypothetical protein [Methanocella sp.]